MTENKTKSCGFEIEMCDRVTGYTAPAGSGGLWSEVFSLLSMGRGSDLEKIAVFPSVRNGETMNKRLIRFVYPWCLKIKQKVGRCLKNFTQSFH